MISTGIIVILLSKDISSWVGIMTDFMAIFSSVVMLHWWSYDIHWWSYALGVLLSYIHVLIMPTDGISANLLAFMYIITF